MGIPIGSLRSAHDLGQPCAVRALEAALDNRRCVVAIIVDVLDFEGSFVPTLHQVGSMLRSHCCFARLFIRLYQI